MSYRLSCLLIFYKERNLIVNKEELLEKTWEHDLFQMYVDKRSHMFKVEKIDASYDIPFGITIEVIDRFEHDENGAFQLVYYIKLYWDESDGYTVDKADEFIKILNRVKSTA